MTYQANPFILAQIVLVFITFGLGIYFLNRPMKKNAPQTISPWPWSRPHYGH
jgi:hypothetical protein